LTYPTVNYFSVYIFFSSSC